MKLSFALQKSEIWTIVGAISGVAAVALTLYIFLADRTYRSKAIKVELVTRSELVNRDKKLQRPEIKLFVGSREAKNFSVVTFRIANDGGQPILAQDFSGPLSIRFSKSTVIAFAEIQDRVPKSLDPLLKHASNQLEVEPLLLNPSDTFTLEVGFTQEAEGDGDITAVARIAGIQDVRIANTTEQPRNRDFRIWIILLLSTLAAAVATSFTSFMAAKLSRRLADIRRTQLEQVGEAVEELAKKLGNKDGKS